MLLPAINITYVVLVSDIDSALSLGRLYTRELISKQMIPESEKTYKRVCVGVCVRGAIKAVRQTKC